MKQIKKTVWGTVIGKASAYIDLVLMMADEPLSCEQIQQRVKDLGFVSRQSPSPHLTTLKKERGVIDNKQRKWFKTPKGQALIGSLQLEVERVTGKVAADVKSVTSNPSISLPVQEVSLFPDEVSQPEKCVEGACCTVTVNAYERDPKVRDACIAAHGTDCAVCEMSFAKEYGTVAEGFIHVHHLRPLSEVGVAHEVDPVADLRPVCPNCHAVIHRRIPAYSIEEVKAFWQQRHK